MFEINQKQLCNKHGNGVCINCNNTEDVICRDIVRSELLIQQGIIEDMTHYIAMNTLNDFKTEKEIMEYFESAYYE